MKHIRWLFLPALLLLTAVTLLAQPVAARPISQVVYATPTALPDGRVVYLVQEGDSCLRIQLLTGVTIEQLRELNRLDDACTLIPGNEILLAVITPAPSPTPNPLITATPLLPTPTPFSGNGRLCVLLYNDVNGNGTRETTEVAIANGAVSISERRGQVSKTANTGGTLDPICEEVPEGDYQITMAIPSGYNATTDLDLIEVNLQPGDQAILEFGAQVSTIAPVEVAAPTPQENAQDLLLAIAGGVLILLGIGLAIYIFVARRG